MHGSVWKSVVLAGAVVLASSSLASAQAGGRARSDRPDEAFAEPPRLAPGVAALALEHASALALADSQRAVLASIRQEQDSASAPWVKRLEALRPTRRPANGPNDLSPEQREEIETRRAAIAEVMEGIRDIDAKARQRAMAVLTPEQQEQAAKLDAEARKKADEESSRRGREAFRGSRGSRGGGMGRPPER